MFNGYLKPYFRTLRDVHRYLGSLRFHVGMHLNNGVFEVNPIDLIAVEALRIFEHSVYERIKVSWLGRQNHFIQLLFGREDRKERVQVALEDILKGESDPNKKERLEGLVRNLFPQASPHYDGTDTGWDRDLRICHENHFSKYFEMAVREDNVSALQMSHVVDAARDRDLFNQKLGKLKENGFLDEVLGRLPQFLEDIPLTSAASFITGLCDAGDSLPPEKPGAFTTDPVVLLARLVQQFVLRCDSKDRLNLLLGMMAQTVGLVVPVMVADAQVRRNRRDQRSDQFLVEEADVPKLIAICVSKIRKEAAEQRLMKSRHFLFFLVRWRLWGKSEDVESWLQQTITSAEAAKAFILSSLTYVTSSGARETQVIPVVHLKVLEQFVSAEKLESLTAELDVNELAGEEATALRLFRSQVERKNAGHNYDDYDF